MRTLTANILNFALFCLPYHLSLAMLDAQELLSVQRVSQASSGVGQNAGIGDPAISANGDMVAFSSSATNLVSNDLNSSNDIFVQNLSSGVTTRVNLGPNSDEGNDDSLAPSISPVAPNGFFAIAFESDATNLAKSRATFPDTNNRRDIYFAIPRINLVERASVATGGIEADARSTEPSITIIPEPNRILIAFTSRASNFISGDLNDRADIYLSTITSPEDDTFSPATNIQTERVSRGISGGEPNAQSLSPKISADGRFVVFESEATNLVANVTPVAKQIYLYEISTQTTTLISKASDGSPGNDDSQNASISYSGNFIVYTTQATNILQDGFVPVSDTLQILRYNVKSGATTRVNVSGAGTPGDATSSSNVSATISPNGRFALFSDPSTNLVSDDTNGTNDIYLKDTSTQQIVRVSRPLSSGEGDDISFSPALALRSFNSTIARSNYASSATNLVSSDTEGRNDIFASSVSIPTLPLTKTTTLEVPADVTLSNDDITVSLEKFSGVNLNGATISAASAKISRAKGRVVRYFTVIEREGATGAERDIRRKISKRNTLTFKNLKPGAYTVKYQARVMKEDRIVRRTNFSPVNRVSKSN